MRWSLVLLVVLGSHLRVEREAAAQSQAERTRAAEHFALAQSAEGRKDWRTAIAEYEEAYRLAPHPSVLFNIAVDHERLGQRREAVAFFRRYVAESPAADDRAAVLRRIEELVGAPSAVTFTATPAGATIHVDGAPVGAAPLRVELAAGSHQIVGEHGGRRSVPRQIVLEYGEPLDVAIDLFALPGLLVVDANVEGAEVRVDGALVGHTPFSGPVPAGEHQVVVALAGHESVQRRVTVTPQGSAQIRTVLQPIRGVGVGAAAPAAPSAGKAVLGTAYGFTAGEGDAGVRYTAELGYRTAGDRAEIGALAGFFGARIGAGIGLASRLYVATDRVRPYVRGAALFGGGESGAAFEAGGGLLIASTLPETGVRAAVALEYFVEVAFQFRTADDEPLDDGLGGVTGRATAAANVPVLVGVSLRFGR